MKVKELIEQLQQLDENKDIWVLYDCYAAQEPSFEPVKSYYVETVDELKEGDYVHYAY